MFWSVREEMIKKEAGQSGRHGQNAVPQTSTGEDRCETSVRSQQSPLLPRPCNDMTTKE